MLRSFTQVRVPLCKIGRIVQLLILFNEGSASVHPETADIIINLAGCWIDGFLAAARLRAIPR